MFTTAGTAIPATTTNLRTEMNESNFGSGPIVLRTAKTVANASARLPATWVVTTAAGACGCISAASAKCAGTTAATVHRARRGRIISAAIRNAVAGQIRAKPSGGMLITVPTVPQAL